ncbi:hypothetical protein AVEN_110691-1 [Araneus ventricosus]|uniref:Ig-like domain-containing protein n=1 Tax=Araneus ventricosus TaxID=182803 RepID=A0A4Y2ATM5_ARAVE|nr:hypothetical protein AVEN_110691-1 [Araneus ventricosus]
MSNTVLDYKKYSAKCCYALRFLNISVPGAVPVGEPVWLKCDFDLEGDDLYSVKWYKNHVEFYRYQPRDRPPGQTYRLAGTFVDLDRSNSSHVLLTSTDLNSEGLYGCEVSGEAPSFSTAKSEDEMRVYGKLALLKNLNHLIFCVSKR